MVIAVHFNRDFEVRVHIANVYTFILFHYQINKQKLQTF